MKIKRKKFLFIVTLILVIVFMFLGYMIAPNNPLEVNLDLRFASPSDKYPFNFCVAKIRNNIRSDIISRVMDFI